MPPFTRIYFDTNVLIAANWPQPSAALERLLSLAHLFRLSVFVPKAVEDELEQHWSRLYNERYSKAKKSFADLQKHAAESDMNLDDVVVVKKDAALAAYRERTRNLKEKWKIETVPLTLRATDELFRMAVCGEPPFQEKDVGFQDTIIYFSVLDDLVKEPKQVGAFVSQDRIFSDPRILDHATAAGITIEVYSNIEDVYKELDNRLETVMKKAWDTDKLRAQYALTQRLSDIQKYLSENLEISEDDLGFGRSIQAVRNLEVQCVRNVQTPFLLDRKENEPVRISFEIELTVTLEIERPYIPQLPSRLKVGQETAGLESRTLGEIFGGPAQEERLMPWVAEAEAVVAPEDKEYRNIQLLSVRSKGPNSTFIIERALGEAPSK
jgi:predicted nucleic acid-binding protein